MTRVASVPNLLVVAPSLGPKSVKELIAYAKARPGQINFSSAGIGSGTQINGAMFRLAAGFEKSPQRVLHARAAENAAAERARPENGVGNHLARRRLRPNLR